MEVDDSSGNVHSCPRDFVKQMSFVMDEHGSQTHPRQSTTRVSTKSKAPSPPALTHSPGHSPWFPGDPALNMEHIDKELSVVVVLPGGVEKMTTVPGSKPLMDLLVTLCAQYHLNPSGHTLELVTSNKNNIKLKPNALIGTLDPHKVLIKPKGEDKNKKTGAHMPEATVRMVINYKQTQKTILRVNPRVPLSQLLPAICEKCEFEEDTTVLLKDVTSLSPLDLSASLNDYAIREVYARDTRVPSSPVCPASPSYTGLVTPGKDKNQKEQENKGLFSMFRKSKKSKPEQATTASAPASPVLVSRPRPLSMALPSSNYSSYGPPGDAPKKRRAPQPPILVSQRSVPADFSPRQRLYSEPCTRLTSTEQTPTLSRGSSTDSSLKRTKRKAPPPPSSSSPSSHTVTEALSPDQLQASSPANTLEEIQEQEEVNSSAMATAADTSPGEDTTHGGDTTHEGDTTKEEDTTQREDTTQGGDTTLGEDTTHRGDTTQGKEGQASTQNALAEDTLPAPPTETAVEMSIELNGEGLSSDGSQVQSEVSHSANVTEEEKLEGEDSAESCPSTCEESTSVQVESSTLPSLARLVQPVLQKAEVQTCPPVEPASPGEQTDPQAPSQDPPTPSKTTAEDAQVQTDDSPLPEPLPDTTPSSPTSSESGKKDMATLTDDLPEPPPPPCPSKVPPELEPKPKPSNELTRDYIPKVGMTTYTIVPQKSLEKLRYFEVALTLESPATASSPDGLDTGSLQLDRSTNEPKTEPSQKEELKQEVTNTTTTATATTTNQGTVNGHIQESSTDCMLPAASTVSQAGSPTESKDIKIPPATKPKPGSFRLSQHKKNPGYYVTSAAEKSQLSNQRQGNPAERATLLPPPLPPSPVQSPVQPPEGATGSPKEEAAVKRLTRQGRVQGKEPGLGLSLEKLRSFAAPRPYSPSTPSRFAQAVSSAVKRSQSLSSTPQSPRSPSFSPTRSPSFSPTRSPSFSPIKSQSPVLPPKQVQQAKVEEHEEHTAEVSTPEPVQNITFFRGTVEVEGETNL